MEINLTNYRPIKFKPYRASESDKKFTREQFEKSIRSGVCSHLSSLFGSPVFVDEQPYHQSIPKRIVVYYSCTINPFTIKESYAIYI